MNSDNEYENDKYNFFTSLCYNSPQYSSNTEEKDEFFMSVYSKSKIDNSDIEIDKKATQYKTNFKEENEKKDFFQKNIIFKTEKIQKQSRLDYLIKKTKIMINNQLIEDLNLLSNKIGKNYKFFKMKTKFTSNTNYKNNKKWLNCTINQLFKEFSEKNYYILKSLIYLKNQKKYLNIINKIDNILDMTYEEYIFKNYSKLNNKYVENIKNKYEEHIYNNCNELKDLLNKIKNCQPYFNKKNKLNK